jgi:hypothetical protein
MIRLSATSIGPIAADILATHHDLEVLAVFERSFYLMAHGGLVCVGAQGIGRGPINVPLAGAAAIDWRQLGIDAEVKAEAHGRTLLIGEEVRISLDAPAWQPPEWAVFSPDTSENGLVALHMHSAQRLPQQGLAALVLAAGDVGTRNPEAKAAAREVATLRSQLPDMLATEQLHSDSIRALTLLLGLGPGLTPSGDDLIGGMMLALTAIDRIRLRDAIWDALTPELGDLTTEISAMHLAAAADGMGAEAVHELANAVLAGDEAAIPAYLDRVGRIGHCSGWDTMAGFALTIAAALSQGKA